ncbi:MAG: hypothetical protein E7202_06805 [Selenomonas ruminantium]|jgi:hypothetical protein|nr:hypothetical protein [Selenomonas ruminantium]
MAQSMVLMDTADVMKVMGFKRTKAAGIVQKANDYTESRGYITPKRGSCYIKAFCKLTGLSRGEVLEVIRPRSEGQKCQEELEM